MAAMNKDFDGDLWSVSREGNPKLGEIAADTDVLLAYSGLRSENYVSVSGRAQIVRDPAKVKELWSEPARVRFPKGPDDPDIALIRVTVDSAEFRDAPSSAWVSPTATPKLVCSARLQKTSARTRWLTSEPRLYTCASRSSGDLGRLNRI